MKAHQRKIREQQAVLNPRPTMDLSSAVVRQITFEEAKSIILKYEWLGNMGTSEIAFGLFLKNELAGVACFGVCFGSKTKVAGAKWADRTTMLIRGACTHWAHPHAASFLITAACKELGKSEWRTWRGACRKPSLIFYACSDVEAGEIGTVYQACGWLYGGRQAAARKFKDPKDGKIKDVGMIKRRIQGRVGRRYEKPTCHPNISSQHPYRCLEPGCCGVGRGYFLWNLQTNSIDTSGEQSAESQRYYFGDTLPNGKPIVGSSVYPQVKLMSRKEMVTRLKEQGAFSEALEPGQVSKLAANPKHFYVGIYADRRTKRAIMKDLRFKPLPYPKRVAEGLGTPAGTTSEQGGFESHPPLQI